MDGEEFFEIQLVKPNQVSESIFYRKETEKFCGNYAVVKAFSKETKWANHTWYGIINRQFETVLEFRLWDKVKLFDSDHIFVQEVNYGSGYPLIRSWHMHLADNTLEMPHNAVLGKYIREVAKNLIIVEVSPRNNHMALYDMLGAKFVSNYFDEIGLFQYINGKIVALAKRKLKNPNIFCYPLEVMCYIDKLGNICSPVYNPLKNEYVDITKENFEGFIEGLEKQIPYYQEERKVVEHLARQLRKENEN